MVAVPVRAVVRVEVPDSVLAAPAAAEVAMLPEAMVAMVALEELAAAAAGAVAVHLLYTHMAAAAL